MILGKLILGKMILGKIYMGQGLQQKFNVTALVMATSILVGCAPNLTPYQLTKSVEIDYRLPRKAIPLGVTQEKISDMEYRITVKVSQYTSKQRAKSMALYHAAVLAEENGFDAIFTSSPSVSPGCSRSSSALIKRTSETREVMHRTTVTEANPFISIKIKFKDYESSRIQQRLMLVEPLKSEHKAIIAYVPTDEELEQNWDENEADCKKVLKGVKRRIRT